MEKKKEERRIQLLVFVTYKPQQFNDLLIGSLRAREKKKRFSQRSKRSDLGEVEQRQTRTTKLNAT